MGTRTHLKAVPGFATTTLAEVFSCCLRIRLPTAAAAKLPLLAGCRRKADAADSKFSTLWRFSDDVDSVNGANFGLDLRFNLPRKTILP